MSITTDKPVSPEKTAEEYALKLDLPMNDKSVAWVREHQKEYLDLVRSKNKLSEENKIDSDKFTVVMSVDSSPGMGTPVTATELVHKYIGGKANPRSDGEFRSSLITINTGIFNPNITAEDRESAIAHEMGHHLKQYTPSINRETFIQEFKKKLEENLGHFKPAKESYAYAGNLMDKNEEFRADRIGGELLHDNERMARALEHIGKISISDGKGGTVKIEDIQNNSDHPTIPARIKALKTQDTETRQGKQK